jgi:glutaredoxin
LLSERGLEFEEINIEEKGWSRDDLFELTGGRTVPQIIIDEKPIGGYDDLLKLDSIGELTT